jgi:hypothetical protein
MWKNAKEFLMNVTDKDLRKINSEKAEWYGKRSYMDFATKMHDFYNEAVKQGLFKTIENNITVEYFDNILEERYNEKTLMKSANIQNDKNFLIKYVKFIASKGHMDLLDFNRIYNKLVNSNENISNIKDTIKNINKNYNVHTNYRNYIESLNLAELKEVIG